MPLVNPHGPHHTLLPRLIPDEEKAEALRRGHTYKSIPLSSRETADLIMLGIGAFTPLTGFMGQKDWRSVCDRLTLAQGTFWPIPITVSATRTDADTIAVGEEIGLVDRARGQLMGSLRVEEKYPIDKHYECQQVFHTTDPNHPGVAKVLAQGEINLAGPVRVFQEGPYPTDYPTLYLRPHDTRQIFEDRGWSTIAALQTRNPLHRSHEYLCRIAIETCDGLLIHQILGQLKPDDLPAKVRVQAVDALVTHYLVPDTLIQAGYPMEMRYAGPREALLHAVIRQNFGCSHLLVGRDHAGVGAYYGPFDAQRAFDQIPPGSLELKPLKIDTSFYCHQCDGMASERTCPHDPAYRVSISGTRLRQMLVRNEPIPDHFSRPEVLAILRQHYQQMGTPERPVIPDPR